MKTEETHSFLVEVSFSGEVTEQDLKGTQDNLVGAIRRQLDNAGISPASTEEYVTQIRVFSMSPKGKDVLTTLIH